MEEEVKEDILTLVDRIGSIEEAMKMPIDNKLHLECVKEFLGEMKEVLKEIANKGSENE